jgi:ribosome-binding protein aMBF1 (putative translation factor)
MASELTTRQWALYNFLKEQGDRWTTQEEAVNALRDLYPQVAEHMPFHDTAARFRMTADIRQINANDTIQKVIISSPKGIKIANEEEFARHVQKEIKAAIRKLLRARQKAAKGQMDGQMRLVFGAERDTVKSFLDSDKAVGERLKEARLKAGLTAAEVVARMQIKSVDAPMLSRFEKGYALPNKTTLAKLAEIYGISGDYLLTGILLNESATLENTDLQVI